MRGSLRAALIGERFIVDNIADDLKKQGIVGEQLSAANERRGHVPWSAERYFGQGKKFSRSDSQYLSACLTALVKRKLVKRIDRRIKRVGKEKTTHVMLTRLGQAWCEYYWFDHIADIFEKNPKPIKNPMKAMAKTGLDWDSVNSEQN
jgi:hypothetical protein